MVVKASTLWKEWLFTEPYAAQGKFEKENLSAKAAQLTGFIYLFINRTLVSIYWSCSWSPAVNVHSGQLLSLGR